MRPPYSCAVPGRKPGTSTKVTIGMSKQSQKRTKRAALREASRVEHAGQHHRLVGDDADGAALHAAEAGDDVLGEGFLDLEEVALVDDLQDQLLDVVGLVGVVGDQRVERGLDAVGGWSSVGSSGTPALLLAGRKSISRRICSSASTSFS